MPCTAFPEPCPMLKPEEAPGVPGCTWATVTWFPGLALDGAQVLRGRLGEPLQRLLHVLLPDAQRPVQAPAHHLKVFHCNLQGR